MGRAWSYGSWVSCQGVLDLTHSHKGEGCGHMLFGWQGVLDITNSHKGGGRSHKVVGFHGKGVLDLGHSIKGEGVVIW